MFSLDVKIDNLGISTETRADCIKGEVDRADTPIRQVYIMASVDSCYKYSATSRLCTGKADLVQLFCS